MVKPTIQQIQKALRTLADEVQRSGLRGYARRIRSNATKLERFKLTQPIKEK